MVVQNIMMVVDLDKDQVSTATRTFLENFVVYKDQSLREDLYSPEEALDDINKLLDRYNGIVHFRELNQADREIVEKEVRQLQALCFDNQAGYVRLIGS